METTNVQKLVYKMLTENTGAHFLDSGGVYGRNWERNQKKSIDDFMNEPQVTYEVNTETGEIRGRTVSVFHYLSNLELDEICDKFNRANTNTKDWDGELYGVSAKGERVLRNYGISEPRVWNTYNGESDLSQILQGANLEIFVDGHSENYILVQVHGGCDARGGYTDAKLFKVTDEFYNIWEYMGEYEIIDGEFYDGVVIDQNGNDLEYDDVQAFIEKYNELA